MALRIGELLERRGVLNALQRDQILAEQRRSGRPFGDLAERLFGVCPRDIEQAWAEQYAALTEPIDPREACVDPDALAMVTARQAWQFSLLPLRFSGDELVVCSTQTQLARAMRFAAWRMPLAMKAFFTPGTARTRLSMSNCLSRCRRRAGQGSGSRQSRSLQAPKVCCTLQ